MLQNSVKGQRIPLFVNAKTHGELKTGNRDVSTVYSLLTNPTIGGCEGHKPIHDCESKEAFLPIFNNLIYDWKKENQLIFYFSGHGDIKRNQYRIKLGLTDKDWHPFSNIINELEGAGVERAIIILDTCHSGAAVDGVRSPNISELVKEEIIPKGIALITSCKKSQHSVDNVNSNLGVFTKLFCDAIETNLDGKGTDDGLICADDIVTYINYKLDTQTEYSDLFQRAVFQIDKADRKIWIAKGKQREDSSSLVQIPPDIQLTNMYQLTNIHPTIQDLDLELLKQYFEQNNFYSLRQELFIKYKFNRDNIDFSNHSFLLELLFRLDFLQNDDSYSPLKRDAVLCFCNYPQTWYPESQVIYTVVEERNSRYFEREYIQGNLKNQIYELVDKVKKYSERKSYISQNNAQRKQIDINEDVVRELISNAITHRDYQSRQSVKVDINPEALEVYNPGGFPDGYSWKRLINDPKVYSHPVNSMIAEYLTKLGLFEQGGSGFREFRNYQQKNGEYSFHCEESNSPKFICIRVLHCHIDPFAGWRLAVT